MVLSLVVVVRVGSTKASGHLALDSLDLFIRNLDFRAKFDEQRIGIANDSTCGRTNVKANGFGANLVLTLDLGRAFKHELGKPAGVAADGFLDQTNVLDIMAKRMSLNAKLVFLVEDTVEAKSRPLHMVIAPPNTRFVVFAFKRTTSSHGA